MNKVLETTGSKKIIVSEELFHDSLIDLEDELDDVVEKIYKFCYANPEEMMQGNGRILRQVTNGYIVLSDNGERMYLPKSAYKGVNTNKGVRIQIGLTKHSDKGLVCMDAMQCVSYCDLRYQMFDYIESRKMALAATSAWAIYANAPEGLQVQMRAIIHKLRNYIKKYDYKQTA